ncbi:hypothetical protein [Vibrio metschnikovii]|uniref:hypothetical protein n=1 Tax=Vibrio metschnikovii TaxID=28172 RepID=UPI001C30292D|nr:hypothetical protein [Vibrio metschnikovii]
MKLFVYSLALISTSAFSSTVTTNDVSGNLYIQKSGYTKIKVDTNLEQRFPLLEVRTFDIPSSVKNIGQALNYSLALSGYKLDDLKITEQKVLNLYTLNLPFTNREFAVATTMQVIETIIGAGFVAHVDDKTRTVRINTRVQS